MSHEQHHLLGDNANHPNVNISGELKGDVLWHNGSAWTRLEKGTSGHFLKISGENVVWATTGGAGNQSLFETISADSGTSPVADTTTDTLNIAGGTAIKTAGDSANDRVSISFSISGEVAGDIPYKTATTWTRLSAGSQNQFLRQGASNVPEWANVVSGEKVKISNTDPIADHLINKIAAGSNVTITKSNSVSGELLTIASTGGGGTLTIQEDDITVGGGSFSTIDFLGKDFNVTESPTNEANVSINVSGEVVGTASVQTLSSKTLLIPTITDLTNMNHGHSNTATGGQVSHTNLTNIGSNAHTVLDTHLTLTTTHGVSGEIVGTTSTQTLTNKTLTTPTIGSFVNAGHNHTNAANGGQIVSGETGRSKVTGNDTTLGYLSGKITAGSGITLTINNAGANESLDIATTGGGAATITVQEDDVTIGSGSFNTVDFNGNDFAVTELPSGEANVSIDYTNAQSASPSAKGFLTAANYTTFADFSGNHTKLSGEHVTNGDSHDHSGGDGAQINHSGLLGLTNDDHSQYPLIAGRSGGQIIYGGTVSGEDLRLSSTSNADKGRIILDDGSRTDIGNAGLEPNGVNVNGTTYDTLLRVNNFGAGMQAQFMVHRHSSTLAPIIMGSRSISNDITHTAVLTGTELLKLLGVGYTGSHYDQFASISFQADSGEISTTSSPGRLVFNITANGAQTPTEALRISQDKTTQLSGKLDINGNAILNSGELTLPTLTDMLVGRNTIDTLTNKTLTTPTIGNFTNATHNHQNAAGGGQIISGENGRVRVSGNDLTFGYLNGKLIAGTNITLTENNDGVDETLTIASTGGAGTQNLFETISADSGTSAVADSTTDTLNIAGGVAIKTAGDSVNDRITISLSVSGEVAGDTLYRTASTWTRLPSGEANQFYQQGPSSVPRWKAIQQTANIGIVVDGGGSAITTGRKGHFIIPFDCTINSATLLPKSGETGNIQVDIWHNTYAIYPNVSGESSICGGNKPIITAGQKYQDNTLTGWSTTLNKNNILIFNVDSITTFTYVSVNLGVTKT